jgi:acetyl esterase
MSEFHVRPDTRAFLDMLAANPRPALNDEMMATMRQLPADFLAALDLPPGELGEVRDVAMPGPAGEIKLRLYDPRASRDPGPVVVFFHGGGFILGSIDTHAGLTAEMARRLDLPVVSVEYRLAPEHKWPAAPDDAEAAVRWIAQNGAAFGREFTHLVLSGDSAGGNLALVVANDLADCAAALPLLAQIAIYPRADGSRDYDSLTAFASGYGMEPENMAYFGQAYGALHDHVRYSPILADLSRLPSTMVVTAGLDPLRDEGRAYAAAAVAAGVPVIYREYKGMIHGFCSYRKMIPSAAKNAADFLDLAKAMIAEALGG